jgi:hypothetical protein
MFKSLMRPHEKEPVPNRGPHWAGSDPLVCIGHSHTGALQAAFLAGAAIRINVFNFWRLPGAIEGTPQQPLLRADIAAQMKAPLISMMGGGAQTVLAICAHPRPFEFILPSAPGLPRDEFAELVPYEAVKARLADECAQFWKLTGLVASLVDGPTFHVDCPPPIADNAFITPHMPWSMFPGRLHEVAPPFHRYRMWRLNTELAKEYCLKTGIGFIAHPKQCEDGEGFLQQQYSDDGIHGNAAYGVALADKISSVVRAGRYETDDLPPTQLRSRP